MLFFHTKQRKTTKCVEYERQRFPQPQRTWCKKRKIKKENIWWAELGARTRQSHVSGKHIPTHTHTYTHTRTHLFMHAYSNLLHPLTCKQAKKKKKKHTPPRKVKVAHMHSGFIVPTRTGAQRGADAKKGNIKSRSRMWLESPPFRQD